MGHASSAEDSTRVEISRLARSLASHLEEGKLPRAGLAFRTFSEYFDRLDARRAEVDVAEHWLRPGNWENSESSGGPSLHDLQLHLVDKTEAFHEHVYATLSALVMLLNHVAPASFRKQMPISSISKFLAYLRERSIGSVVHEHLTQLERSVLFRNRFVMHPQQHVLHDWSTHSTGSLTAIIYFVPAYGDTEEEIRRRLEQRESEREGDLVLDDPYHPNFELSISHESFYVSPHVARTHTALRQVVLNTLRVLEAGVQRAT